MVFSDGVESVFGQGNCLVIVTFLWVLCLVVRQFVVMSGFGCIHLLDEKQLKALFPKSNCLSILSSGSYGNDVKFILLERLLDDVVDEDSFCTDCLQQSINKWLQGKLCIRHVLYFLCEESLSKRHHHGEEKQSVEE